MSRQLRLVVDESSCTIEPVTPGIQGPRAVVIDRNTSEIRLANAGVPQASFKTIYGIFGVIRLNAGLYLIAITKAEKVGQIQDSDVFQIRETSIINLGKEKGLSPSEAEDDANYLRLLNSVLAIEFFYFSYDYDLTRSAQRAQGKNRSPGDALWKNADERFFWNRYLLKDFIDKAREKEVDLVDFILPITLGFVSINHADIDGRKFDYILITRRNVRRAGTRYNTRGIDVDGNVANFNETEQIVFEPTTKTLLSYTQTRGSIPIFWRQLINLKYTPELAIEPADNSLRFAQEHFREQQELYGEQIVVNLINGGGYEGKVNKAFGDLIAKLQNPQLHYIHFDFHAECKKMRFDKVSKLVDKITDLLDTQKYYHSERGEVKSQQKSVVRTNCMDCLDRTNVVQSVLARRSLRLQLIALKIIGPTSNLEEFKTFDALLRNVWADNADAVSLVYSGTGALKTDYTRTGKRTQLGAVQDGINSMWRYIGNNFLDGSRQDGFDLLLGNFVVRPGSPSPFQSLENTDNAIRRTLIPSLLALSLFMFLTSLAVPADSWSLKIFYLLFWSGIIYFSLQTMLKNSADFVSKPKFSDPVFGKKSRKD